MLAAETLARAGGGPHDERCRELAARKIPHCRRLGGQRIECDTGELHEHHFDDGP
jgi:hypothetical protein